MWYDREPSLQGICVNYIFTSILCTHSFCSKHTLNQACSYNDVIIPIYIFKKKLNYSRDWQDLKLLALIVVCAKTNIIFNVMKVIYICHHNCSPNYLWNELHKSLVIATNPYIFYYVKKNTNYCVDEPKCSSQFLIMVTQMKHFLHIMQHKIYICHICHSMH